MSEERDCLLPLEHLHAYELGWAITPLRKVDHALHELFPNCRVILTVEMSRKTVCIQFYDPRDDERRSLGLAKEISMLEIQRIGRQHFESYMENVLRECVLRIVTHATESVGLNMIRPGVDHD